MLQIKLRAYIWLLKRITCVHMVIKKVKQLYRLWRYTNPVCLDGAKMGYELTYMKRNGTYIELYNIK